MSTGPTPSVRDQVKERARRHCERCGIPMDRPGHIHHRQPRKMGGTSRPSINYPSNLLFVCAYCHMQIEERRTRSTRYGWLVPEPALPAEVPVKLWDGWHLLADDGSRVSVSAPAALRGLSNLGLDG